MIATIDGVTVVGTAREIRELIRACSGNKKSKYFNVQPINVPEHVKNYQKHNKSYEYKGDPLQTRVWF